MFSLAYICTHTADSDTPIFKNNTGTDITGIKNSP